MEAITQFFVEKDIILLGIMATIGTGLATGVGALPVLFTRNVSDRLLDGMLGFAAGVMLAATAFSFLQLFGYAQFNVNALRGGIGSG